MSDAIVSWGLELLRQTELLRTFALHFLWQAPLVTFLVAGLLGLPWFRNPKAAHHLLVSALALLIAAPLMTALLAPPHQPWLASLIEAAPHDLQDDNEQAKQIPEHVEADLGVMDAVELAAADDREPNDLAWEGIASQAESESQSNSSSTYSSVAAWIEDLLGYLATFLPAALLAATLLWCGVALVRLARLAGGLLQVRRLIQTSEPASAAAQEIAGPLSQALQLRRQPTILVSDSLDEAAAVGLADAKVILPRRWAESLDRQMLRAVLAHELAHIRRADLWVLMAQRVVESLLPFHPAVAWMSLEISRQRELCCDAEAIRITGERLAYAQTLQRVADWKLADVRPALSAGIRGESNMNLLSRVKLALGLPAASPAVMSRGLLAAIAVPGIVALVGAGFAPSLSLADDEERTVEVREDENREAKREGAPAREREVGERERDPNREVERDREGDREGRREDRPAPRRDEQERAREVPERENPEMRELIMLLRKLNAEVSSLRAEVNQLKANSRMQPDRPRPEADRPRPEGDRPRGEGDRPREVARPDQPRPDQPRPDQPRREPDRPRPDQPRPDQPRPDQPRPDQPKREGDRPRAEEPKREEPRREEPRREGDKPVEQPAVKPE